MNRWIPAALTIPFALAACGDDDPTGPAGSAQVRLAFSTTASPSATSLPSLRMDELSVAGSNGTLLITDVQLIVAEFELEGDDDACEALTGDDDCMEFEAPPALLDLPLSGGEVIVATANVPAGTYDELEFEVEDLDEDDDDSQLTRDRIQQIRSDLLALYPGFPQEASMVVSGTFTPTGGAAQPFTVYFDADIEVELDLVPALVVDTAGAASRTITVNLQPDVWFSANGQVLDLSAFDGETLDFELEIEEGFEVELDDDDDDDDDNDD